MEEKPAGQMSGGAGNRKQVAVDEMNHPPKRHMLPVWFFIGLTLLAYGIMILVTGIQELSQPPTTVLARLHAPIWWGAIMAVVGAVYVNMFRPRS